MTAPALEAVPAGPLARARTRLRGWWLQRMPRTDTLTLTQRNVYLLPTRAGLMLAATVLVLLVGAINYQLNLGYLLTFLLAGSALAGMYVGHGTLRGLTLNLRHPEPQFAGAAATLEVVLASGRRSPRYGIGVAVREGAGARAWTDVPAGGRAVVQVAFRPMRRGLHPVPPLTVDTRFPLGTFRIWTVWRPAAQVLVYPAPEPHPPPLPAGEPRPGTAAQARTPAAGDFEGVRAYRRGDPLKLVVWKKAAKTDDLVSRDTLQARREELWLDVAQAGPAGHEARLARLAAWVLQADRLGLAYGLRLPGLQVAPATGEAHKRRCLEALALC